MKAKISYEDDGKQTRIDVEATGHDLMKAVSRIAYHAKAQLEIPTDKFIECIKDGMKVAELENKVNNNPELGEFMDLLKRLLDA